MNSAVDLREVPLTVRQGTPADRNHILPLIYFEPFVHQQAGWRPPLEWIEEGTPYLLLCQRERVQAVWLTSMEEPGIAWLRLFGVARPLDPAQAWDHLWPHALKILQEHRVRALYLMPFSPWLAHLIQGRGFRQVTRVRNLLWTRQPLPPPRPLPSPLRLRSMTPEDLPAVLAVDRAAFPHPWKLTAADLQRVWKEALHATVVEDPQGIVGFQISTAGVQGAHLARLAVHPRAQRRGAGFALVHQALTHLARQEVYQVTVNTWAENLPALRLYQRFGFAFALEDHPLYRFDLDT